MTDEAPHDERRKHPRSPLRVANAWVAVVISLLFCVHLLLGAVFMLWPEMPTHFVWVVWLGVGTAALHVLMSAATTYTMFTDAVRPASQRKKSHQKLKWLTGTLLAAAVAAHQLSLGVLDPATAQDAEPVLCLLMACAAVCLCVHLCTGVKSLTRDIGLPAAARTPFKVVAIGCASASAALLLLSCL
ncbi:MAG: hypothetical protein ACI36W_06520 [Coriobacteriales bacterium]